MTAFFQPVMYYAKALTVVKACITGNVVARETTLPHLVQLRLPDAMLKSIDDWRRNQPDIPTRSESIRRLIEKGLKADKPI